MPDYSEGMQIKTEDPDPRFNNALARGLALLRAFQIDRTLLGNLELAQITGLARPTVSRLSYTLTRLGYLRYREEFGKYELAAGVVGLAYPYLANQAVPPIARPLMVELARKTETNVGLGVQEELSVFYLEYALGEANPNRLQRAGFRVPVARTAMGRACIAGMRPEQRERLYEHMRAVLQGRVACVAQGARRRGVAGAGRRLLHRRRHLQRDHQLRCRAVRPRRRAHGDGVQFPRPRAAPDDGRDEAEPASA